MNRDGSERSGLRAALSIYFLVVLSVPVGRAAQPAADGPDADRSVTFSASFTLADLQFGETDGFDTVVLPDGGRLGAPGRPALPTRLVRLALPAGMRATAARVVRSASEPVAGEFDIWPAQPPQRISQVGPVLFIEPDPAIYGAAAPYPASPVELQHQADLAGTPIAYVAVCPLQYVPAERRLVLLTTVEFELVGTPDWICGDYLPFGADEEEQAEYAQRVARLVDNPDSAVPMRDPEPAPLGRGVPAGDYDYVIVTDPGWVSAFQPLADWKTRKGAPATIVTTEWIYNSGGYSGTQQEKIRAFVINALNTWGTNYVLLGGDTDWIPASQRSYLGDNIPNDTYYSDFDNDWMCEVHVGRAPVRTTSQITTFVNKVLAYEQNPPLTNYAKCAFFCGFDLHHDGSGEGEGMMEAIYSLYMPESWTYRREYDSEPGGHLSDTLGYLNQGNNLVNHSDHSSTDFMGVGYTVHGTGLTNSSMTALTNGTRQSILYTLGCWACNYEDNTCIAESFVQNNNGGGVAFIGNSRYGWYMPGETDGVSARYDRYFFRSLWTYNYTRLGECFSDHKNDAFLGDDYYRYIFTELTLLGDPELRIWTENPVGLTANLSFELYTNQYTSFPVDVYYADGPVSGAKVCLYKPGDVYEVATTNSAGRATFWFAPATTGPMYVTITKANCLPLLTQAVVSSSTGPYLLTVDYIGQGAVTLDPPDNPYAPGTVVTLTADPADGWCFEHWSNGLSGSQNPATITMNGDRIVVAHFALDCNANGVSDATDIAGGYSADCNFNNIPDECDIARGVSDDCQPNGVPDECDLAVPADAPATDLAADAAPIRPAHWYTGTTVGATTDGSSSCGGSSDVWYRYRPTGSGLFTLSLCGSEIDTVLSLHTGCPGTADNQLACNDDFCDQQSLITGVVYADNDYWIRIAGKNGATGQFQLALSGPDGGSTYECNDNGIPDECEPDCNGNGSPDDCDIAAGVSQDLDGNGVPDECQSTQTGDMNCDGVVNALDINPFVLAITSPTQYVAQYPLCNLMNGDCDGDGAVNALDINPFVRLISGG